MIRASLESLTGKPWTTDGDAMEWFLPYKGTNADPTLAARFHALAELPDESFGHAFAAFYLSQKYAFPGEEQALNFNFAAPHEPCRTSWRATTPRRAANCWYQPSRPPCTARRRCPVTCCR